MKSMKNRHGLVMIVMAALAVTGCSNELTSNGSPVELVVTNTQTISRIDIDPASGDPDCAQTVGTINMTVIARNETVSGPMTQVRVKTYRVSYRRIDGGTLVPNSFVRPIDTLIGVGESSGNTLFQLAESGIFNRAPFAALLPQNGGIDPETGKRFVTLQVFVEVFGETLGGDDVYDSTSFPLEFCYACGGCG